MKKLLVTLLILLLLPVNMAAAAPTVTLNGSLLTFDVDPIIEDGRALVPLRPIFEAMGATVTWDAATQTAIATTTDTTVMITIDSKLAMVNNIPIGIDVPAKIVDNRTLAPLRFVGEAFGGTVTWDGSSQRILISTRYDFIPSQLPETDETDANDPEDNSISQVVDEDSITENPESDTTEEALDDAATVENPAPIIRP